MVVLLLLQETVVEMIPVSGSSNGVNALGLVVFSMCFGLVIGSMKQQGQALRDFFDCLNEAIMRLVAIVIWSVVRLVFTSNMLMNSNVPLPLLLTYISQNSCFWWNCCNR
jgi:Na+/H+-dicarboxylate symporter